MTKEQLLNTLLISDVNSLSLFDIFLTFTLPFLLTVPVALFYRYTSKSNNYSVEFIHSLLLFSSMTSIITLLIGSNIARAFGLVAALSLIRFRTALKSTLDAMYLFWALTIGMACGTGFYFAASMIVILGITYVWLVKFFRFGAPKHLNLVVRAIVEDKNHSSNADEIESLMQKDFRDVQRLNMILTESGERAYIYSAEAKLDQEFSELENKIKSISGVKNLELVNSEAALFV
ncbi:MAG: DUF4956 domain-containing protein [Bacteriovoracaceae bacterium]|nr:DUF4956 domain-containing protein [Bacteriovoracaceae bacterium]